MVINNSQARRFAKLVNSPVIIWSKKLSGTFIENISNDDLKAYKRNVPLLQDEFVKGADAYLNTNINAILGLVNVTKVRLHSITLSSETVP